MSAAPKRKIGEGLGFPQPVFIREKAPKPFEKEIARFNTQDELKRLKREQLQSGATLVITQISTLSKLPAKDSSGTSDPYFKLFLTDAGCFKTPVIEKTLTPTFYLQDVLFPLTNQQLMLLRQGMLPLHVECYDHNTISDTFIGYGNVTVNYIATTNGMATVDVGLWDDKKHSAGAVRLHFAFDVTARPLMAPAVAREVKVPTPVMMNQVDKWFDNAELYQNNCKTVEQLLSGVSVTVKSVTTLLKLPAKDGSGSSGTSDPYLVFWVGEYPFSVKSYHHNSNLTPVWNFSDIVVPLPYSSLTKLKNGTLLMHVEVWDKDNVKDEFMCYTNMYLSYPAVVNGNIQFDMGMLSKSSKLAGAMRFTIDIDVDVAPKPPLSLWEVAPKNPNADAKEYKQLSAAAVYAAPPNAAAAASLPPPAGALVNVTGGGGVAAASNEMKQQLQTTLGELQTARAQLAQANQEGNNLRARIAHLETALRELAALVKNANVEAERKLKAASL